MIVAKSEIVGMKNWDDTRQRWIGVVCQIMEDGGKEFVQCYDVVDGKTQVEVDDAIMESIRTKPWLKYEAEK